MAEVFVAAHVGAAGFERSVCVKRIRPELAGDAGFRELFVREAAMAGQLSHANLVQFHDCVELDDTFALIMELVDGMDLRALVRHLQKRGRSAPEPIVAHIAGQLLCGLRYAHHHRVVHRDISPHNVLVSRQGEVKLADFGVAKAMLTQATRTGDLKGKIAYMSPEQALGGDVDHRTDLYSAGLVLFELLTARRYFPRVSHQELLGIVSRAPHPHLDGVDPELARVVEGLLQPNPSDRIQSAEEALQELPSWPSIGPFGAVELTRFLEEIQLELATTIRDCSTIPPEVFSDSDSASPNVEASPPVEATLSLAGKPCRPKTAAIIPATSGEETRSRSMKKDCELTRTKTGLLASKARELLVAKQRSQRIIAAAAFSALILGSVLGVLGGLALSGSL